MTVRPASSLPIRSPIARLVLALVAMAQLVVVAIAPSAEARADRGKVQMHVEAAGTRLHHVHVETLCASCVAQHLVSTGAPSATVAPAARRVELPGAVRRAVVASTARFGVAAPRAPPAAL